MQAQAGTSLIPLLVVRRAAQAIHFYQRSLGAKLVARFDHGSERTVGHADLEVFGMPFSLTEEALPFNSVAPSTLGGSPVVLQVGVPDVDAVVSSMTKRGATVVFPVQELLGRRMARVRDPFGHLWLVEQRLRELSPVQEQRERDALFEQALEAHPQVQEISKVRDWAGSAQAEFGGTARHCARAPRGALHLVLGPVGAGKTTFAQRLAQEQGALRLTLDDWMVTLFSPDRPAEEVRAWYQERCERAVTQIWKLSRELAALGQPVVLELGLLLRRQRAAFYRRVDEAGLQLCGYVLEASREVRRRRVLERNQQRGETFSMLVPPEFFELASDLWEAPRAKEIARRRLRLIRTDLDAPPPTRDEELEYPPR